MIDKSREKVQKEAIQSALDSIVEDQMRCTLEIATGIGKTFIAFHLIKQLQPKTVLFLAETTMRENNIKEDIEKFKALYGYDLNKHHNITYACYQSAYRWLNTYFDFVCADEHLSVVV